MNEAGSVTLYLRQLQAGDRAALQKLWEGYFGRLVGLARKRLQGAPCQAADGEDAALSAFDSFHRGVEMGRFPRLEDRNDLWQVLVLLTKRKASNLARHAVTQKEGGGRVVSASALERADEDGRAFAGVVGREPEPGFAAEVAEECRRLLTALPDPELRTIAVWRMEGRSNQEIAGLIDRDDSAVERKLKRIRAIWTKMAEA